MGNVVKIGSKESNNHPLDKIVNDYMNGELYSLHVTALYKDGTIVPFISGDLADSVAKSRAQKNLHELPKPPSSLKAVKTK